MFLFVKIKRSGTSRSWSLPPQCPGQSCLCGSSLQSWAAKEEKQQFCNDLLTTHQSGHAWPQLGQVSQVLTWKWALLLIYSILIDIFIETPRGGVSTIISSSIIILIIIILSHNPWHKFRWNLQMTVFLFFWNDSPYIDRIRTCITDVNLKVRAEPEPIKYSLVH